MAYDYRENIKEDIIQYLTDNWYDTTNHPDRQKLEEELYDELRIEDSVTWNASGSYTFNTAEARENIEGNEDILEDVISEFWINMAKHRNDYEYLDVSIRCYLLGECIHDALDEREQFRITEEQQQQEEEELQAIRNNIEGTKEQRETLETNNK